jgi:hypothetical protein
MFRECLDLNPLLGSACFRKPHMGYFRVSICTPGDGQGAQFFTAEEEGILNDYPGS